MAIKPQKISIKGAAKEAKSNREFDTSRRDNAKNILSPDQIQGKNWRATKVLMTTLGLKPGDEPRPITKQDLLAFNRNIMTLQAKVEKGVTANEVISMSTIADKKRSRQQIHTAIPVKMKSGYIHFMTDAGPGSKVSRKVSRHHVHIILSGYETGLAKGTPLQAAREIARGNLKFDCDCEHHTFVFRFITTLMGANAGRAETGFPKLRNPMLEGIACKHVLRVMVELNTSIFIWKKIAAMVEADRKQNADKTRRQIQKVVNLKQSEANDLSAKQHKNQRSIKVTEAARDREKLAQALMEDIKPHRKTKPGSKLTTDQAAEFMAREGIPRSAVEAMFARGVINLSRGTTKEAFLKAFDQAVKAK